ncbi:C45 family autoproteolytic acyltransferase/hydolase [Bacillus manliponensis]|uniref:C45 family autoproteolytic acyltransferase/hydolase n=1 Tax=Bacillus manliponensis TaxID=574376 RepID=UPI003515EC97
MSKFEVPIIQMRDSSFYIGLNMSRYIQNSSILKTLDRITKPEIDYKNIKAIYSAFAPHILDELEGLCEGLAMTQNKAAALFSGYDVPKMEAMGCSAIITKDYYVRNYDFSPVFYDGYFSLFQPKDVFASAGYNLQVIGRHDGVNEHGLVIGLHFVSNHDYSVGVSAWTAVRMVLDTCMSVEDAIHMLKEIPHAACYNFSLGDKKGNIAVVEASPTKVIVRKNNTVLSCVNHFQDPELIEKNRVSIEGSQKRNDYLQSFQDGNVIQVEMFQNFSNENSPVFFTEYENLFGTLHTFSYSFHDGRILTTLARGNEILDINFNGWIEGEDIEHNCLTGIIENK